MKKTILSLLMIMLFIPMMVTGCKSETPTDVVNTYFSSIKKSDSKEAQKLIEDTISDEILNEETGTTSTKEENTDTSKKEDSEKLDESLKMYLSKIDAKVLSEKVNEDKATVKVEIKAPNYSDLLLAVMEESIADTFNGKEETGTTSTKEENTDTSKKEDSEKLDESLKMYLSKIDAKVLSEKVNEDKATVKVEIKAPNYSDLLLAVMEESIADTFNGKEVKQSDVEKNLEEKIKSSKAETRSGQINLTKKDNEWKIKSDEDITNLLLGEADEKESVMFSK